jgi:hypothetical protein
MHPWDNNRTTTVLETTPTIAVRKREAQAKISNRAGKVADLDGRRRNARRVRDLVAAFTLALGGRVTADVMMKIKRAAELVTAAEALRASFLRGEPVDQLALSRLQGCSDRAVRALGIKDKPARSSLAEYLAQKAAPNG